MQQDRRSISPAMQGFRLRLHNCQNTESETWNPSRFNIHLLYIVLARFNQKHLGLYARKLTKLLENGQ